MLQETLIAAAAGSSSANAMNKMGFAHLMEEMIRDPGQFAMSWVVLIALVIMSGGSWFFVIVNYIKTVRIRGKAEQVIKQFWQSSAKDAITAMEKQPASEPFSKIALDAAQAAAHHQRAQGEGGLASSLNRSEFVDRALRQAVTRESAKLNTGMTFLASVGATAPFIGLLGTVWGIYGALISIGASGQASIDAVAGPVGEALIMTALGLLVAIPAVLAYNFLSGVTSAVNTMYDNFAHDLHDFFATGSRVGG